MNSNQNIAVKKMNDQQLLAHTDKLVSEERRITLEVLQHLREIEVRRLFVDLGFDSMYKYCIQRLKYSEGEAQRRLSAARLLRELPEIESQIQNGDLNMTNLSAVQSFIRTEKMANQPLSREKKLELISAVENKPTRQVKNELVQQSHQPALLADKFQMSATMNFPTVLTKFETIMTNENVELLQEFRNLYAHDLPDLSNQSVLMFLLKKAVHHKKQKLGLIEKMLRKPNAPLPSAANAKGIKFEKQRKPLTAKTKRMVWKRANACCEHLDAQSKTRCSSKFALETDHIIAVALGGTNEPENLQLLCRAHNSRRSIKTFGQRL
jgi:adenylate cyclase class IV